MILNHDAPSFMCDAIGYTHIILILFTHQSSKIKKDAISVIEHNHLNGKSPILLKKSITFDFI